jgi:hypothetical protein
MAERPIQRPSTTYILRRMICALVLVPIVPTSAIVVAVWATEIVPLTGGSHRCFDLCCSTFLVAASIVIWRWLIVWTLGRKVLTGLVSMIPFVQVIHAKPLWNAGCVLEDFLVIGQEQLGIALWVWLMVWVWWGWERFGAGRGIAGGTLWRTRMNQGIRLVVASIGTLPFVVAIFFILAAVLDDLVGVPGRWLPCATFLLSACVAVGAWLLIWRRRVEWSAKVTKLTAGSALLCIGLPVLATVGLDNVSSGIWEVCLNAAPVLGWGVWMAATMWIWPLRLPVGDLPEEGPVCPKCRYLLKGLTHTRCPECGDEPTLDELWAANAVGSV